MKALSFKQPWAWAILYGGKDIDNRPWKTNFRGQFLIHASKTFDEEGWLWMSQRIPEILPHRIQFQKGGIVGSVKIIDCVTQSCSKWFFGPYGFVLRDAEVLPFRPYKGKLGFFEVEDGGQS